MTLTESLGIPQMLEVEVTYFEDIHAFHFINKQNSKSYHYLLTVGE